MFLVAWGLPIGGLNFLRFIVDLWVYGAMEQGLRLHTLKAVSSLMSKNYIR